MQIRKSDGPTSRQSITKCLSYLDAIGLLSCKTEGQGRRADIRVPDFTKGRGWLDMSFLPGFVLKRAQAKSRDLTEPHKVASVTDKQGIALPDNKERRKTSEVVADSSEGGRRTKSYENPDRNSYEVVSSSGSGSRISTDNFDSSQGKTSINHSRISRSTLNITNVGQQGSPRCRICQHHAAEKTAYRPVPVPFHHYAKPTKSDYREVTEWVCTNPDCFLYGEPIF